MPKNIVVCCDGTGNGFDYAQRDSNVVKLYRCLEVDEQQVAYYHPGVGTLGDPSERFWLLRQWSKIKGLAFGAGLKANVADAYRFLMDKYEDGDCIYLIGFSRGAYTVRVLAGVLHMFGLLCAGNDGLIPYVMRMFSEWSRKSSGRVPTAPTNEVFKAGFSHKHKVSIRFCGVWDTVSAYGWLYKPIKLPFEGINPLIQSGRQALSIHERRCFYSDKLWGDSPPGSHQDILQVWFAGVHSDVGGSYLESEGALSKITLEWMLVEAQKQGLRLNQTNTEVVLGRTSSALEFAPAYVCPSENGLLHNSLTPAWWLPECWPQRDPHPGGRFFIPLGRGRILPPGSCIHQTALEGPYCPRNLPHGYIAVAGEAFVWQRQTDRPDCGTESDRTAISSSGRYAPPETLTDPAIPDLPQQNP